jgi:hypothetical protein
MQHLRSFLVSCTAFYGTLWWVDIFAGEALSYNSRSAWWAFVLEGNRYVAKDAIALAGDTVCSKVNIIGGGGGRS